MTSLGLVEGTRQRVANGWREPMYRAAVLLGASSGLSAVLGVVFWLAAARLYSPHDVGLSSTALSSMMLISGIAQLNLMSMLLRFVPEARHPVRMIALTFGCAGGLTAACALVFVLGTDTWSPGLRPLLDGPGMKVGFVLATACWTVFVLQSATLVALRRPGASTALTQGFNALKVLLMPVAAVTVPAAGLWWSWTGAAAVATAVGLAFIFLRAAPASRRARAHLVAEHSAADLARYVGPDYVASLAWIAVTSLVPVIVFSLTDPARAAVFALVWQMCLVLYSVPIMFGQSLVAHGTDDPGRLDEHFAKILGLSLALLAPVVLVLVLFAPQVLAPFGSWYATEGVGTVRLLALSTLPNAVVALAVSQARVERRMRRVVVATTGVAVLVLVLTVVLVPRVGIAGAGAAWLCAQLVVAAAIMPQLLPPFVVRSLRPRVPGAARRRALEAAGASFWLVERTLRSVSDTTALVLRSPEGPRAVLKVATSEPGTDGLRRERAVLAGLASLDVQASWHRLVPDVLREGTFEGGSYVMLRCLPGRECGELGLDPRTLTSSVLDAMTVLYTASARRVVVDDEILGRVVDGPVGRLRAALPRTRPRLRRSLDRLAEELHGALAGTTLLEAQTHGDLFPGNVLLSESGEVSGIIDWAQSDARGLPALDLAFWMLCVSASARGESLGHEVARRLRFPECWSAGEREVLDRTPGGSELPSRVLVLLAWLAHVDANLTKSARYAASPAWARRTVVPVLPEVDRPVPEVAPVAPEGLVASAATKRARRRVLLQLVPLALALAAWLMSLRNVDLRAMDDLGLLSVLHPGYWVALVAVVASTAVLIHRDRSPAPVLVAYLVALVAILHATPSLLYDAPRYSWAWKHVGIVDYIVRHGGVHAQDGDAFMVYQSWPGFFALNAVLVKAAGLPSALSYAGWAPPVFELAALAPLRLLFGALVADRRRVWFAVLVFYLGNWVGQDYFSPQAFTYVLALVVLMLCLRWLPPDPAHARELPRWRRWLAGEVPGRMEATSEQRRVVLVTVVGLMAVIVSSHQLTPLMLLLWLSVLVLGRNAARPWLPWLLAVMTVTWALVMGRAFLIANLQWILTSVGRPEDNAQTFVDLGHATFGQVAVSYAARGLTAAMGLLALLGLLRLPRGKVRRLTFLLAAAPGAMLVANNYGGEMLFRVYLFALPFLALLAAGAVYPRARVATTRPGWAGAVVPTALVLTLTAALTVAYYGKERMNYFSPQEVDASTWFYDHAPTGSTMVTPAAALPWAWTRYEDYDYLFLENLPGPQRRRLPHDPVRILHRATRYVTGDVYVILMRTQDAAVRYTGTLPPDAVPRLESALATSPDVTEVYRNADAVVFELAAHHRSTS